VQQAIEIGVKGVPLYVINGREAISGAQAPSVFARAVERAVATVA
jgi:predicted DsbA family dithiol-disulfide isomerase